MSKYAKLESDLGHGWKTFLRTLSCQVAVREIARGLDERLQDRLKQSHFFKQRLEKISPNFKKWPKTRIQEWAEARRVELSMEKQFLEILEEDVSKKTDLQNQIMLSSISHTNTPKPLVVGVSCLFPKELSREFQGVGVDIESVDRKLKPEVVNRFLGPDERRQDTTLHPLDYWVMKEAAFKATPRDLQLVVTDYKLQDWNPELKEGAMVSKNVRCLVKVLETSGFKLGMSYFRF